MKPNHRWQDIAATVVVGLMLGIGATSSGQVEIVKTGGVETEEIAANEYALIPSTGAEKRAVGYLVSGHFAVWNLATGAEEARVNFPEGKAAKWVRINRAFNNDKGESVVAVYTKNGNIGQDSKLFILNINAGTKLEVTSTSFYESTVLLKEAGKTLLGVTAATPGAQGQPWKSHNIVVDIATLTVLSRVDCDFSGELRLFTKKDGSVVATITGYEVIAVWELASGKVEKLHVQEQPSGWPTLITLPDGNEALLAFREGREVLYSLAELINGKLVTVKELATNQSVEMLDNDLVIVEREIDKNAGKTKTLSLADFETGSLLGRVSDLNLQEGQRLFTRVPEGQITAIIYGRTNPNLFVSPSRIVSFDLAAGKTIAEIDFNSDQARVSFARSAEKLFAMSAQWIGMEDKATIFDMATGEKVFDSFGVAATGLMRLKDTRVSVLVNPGAEGGMCAVDLTDGNKTHCVGADLVPAKSQHLIRFDEEILSQGDEIVIPRLEPRATGELVTKGLNLIRLK